MIHLFNFLLILLMANLFVPMTTFNAEDHSTMLIKKTTDFEITGDGTATNWQKTDWVELTQRRNHENTYSFQTKVKVLYSDTGLYVLFHCDDRILNATFTEHFAELWHEDVVEVFLWTDESSPDYFEYELSPLNYELPLIVSNIDGELLHWIPFLNSYHEENDRKTRHKTSILGGEKESGAIIDGWTAEMFIPFKLLHPLENIYPESGTRWRANMYRIDYDDGMTPFSWQPYESNFHDYRNFGTFLFE
jgi:hypothetical protein